MLNLLFLKKLISEKEYEKIKLKLRKIYTNWLTFFVGCGKINADK